MTLRAGADPRRTEARMRATRGLDLDERAAEVRLALVGHPLARDAGYAQVRAVLYAHDRIRHERARAGTSADPLDRALVLWTDPYAIAHQDDVRYAWPPLACLLDEAAAWRAVATRTGLGGDHAR